MDTLANLHHVKSSDHFKDLLSKDLRRISLLYFWAPWTEPCKQMTEVVAELSRKYEQLLSLQIEAEEQVEISESFDIESVPSFIVLQVRYTFTSSSGIVRLIPWSQQTTQGHTLLARISGADARALAEAIAKHLSPSVFPTPLSHSDNSPAPPPAVEKTEMPEDLEKRLRELMNQSKVVLFMKGSPDVPRCGFSRKISGLLRDQKIDFSHFDILTEESVRQGILVSRSTRSYVY
jgi:thiol-disulfide isomerase/thioredoxin